MVGRTQCPGREIKEVASPVGSVVIGELEVDTHVRMNG